MTVSLLFCTLFVVPHILALDWENEFDTYNVEECGKRVRRNWNSLTETEQDRYIRGLIELRARGSQSTETDEFHRIANVHATVFGGIVHDTSMFFFWHSYVLWELESRIRNLGGEWACFAMPYWDFWTTERTLEQEHGYMFQKSMGGTGDANNSYTVTEDWPWTTEQFWVPFHCHSDGDVYPLCSFKRAVSNWTQLNWPETGRIFTENPGLLGMQKLFANYQGNSRMVMPCLRISSALQNPTTSSYDPIWYLFHSMITYQQYMWQDCNDYDQIDPDDLGGNDNAYSAFLTQNESELINVGVSPNMSLDAQMYFDDSLQLAEWSFINQSTLTVRKSYHLHRWNVIYDLDDGSGFFEESGFRSYCGDKLNPEWFWISKSSSDTAMEHEEVKDFTSGRMVHSQNSWTAQTAFGAMVFAFLLILSRSAFSRIKKEPVSDGHSMYGAIKPLAV